MLWDTNPREPQRRPGPRVWSQSPRVQGLGYQGFRVSGFRGFRVSGFQGLGFRFWLVGLGFRFRLGVSQGLGLGFSENSRLEDTETLAVQGLGCEV